MHSLTNRGNHASDQEKTREDWRSWAHQLHRLRLANLAAAFLEAGGAVSALAAQALYVGQPMLDPWAGKDGVKKLAELLEDPAQAAAFTQFLKEGTP